MYHCFFFVSGWVCAVVFPSSMIENVMYRTRTIFAAATDVIAAYVEFPKTYEIRIWPDFIFHTTPKVL